MLHNLHRFDSKEDFLFKAYIAFMCKLFVALDMLVF